ncbi:MAG TPA: glycosyltransferase 87 family protein [Candidatus Binataceae bacterium]|nr:glycosyltransferase 87 family protein [Candidatus Binataceae bacterium]
MAALNQWPLVALLCAAALVRVILVLISLQGRYANNDYSGYYLAAYAMRHGLDPYRLDLTALGRSLGLQIGYLIHAADTPSFLAMFEPLTLLSPRPAYWTWMGLNAMAFVAALIMLLWRADGMRRTTLWLLVALAVLYPPLTFNMGWGQSQPLVLFLLALAMTALESRRDALAGLALAAAALLRAFPSAAPAKFPISNGLPAIYLAGVPPI